ncbi:Pre-rRNA-processing protein TSR2, motif protein [Medicago truncatula]|uniref:Pre-rRNA-processing protein TSR2, motif protein n=1 Tax=Medicago truncatula TaxID=3880 RepID=G7K3N5_MEDTR|nr:Pre-rRNA-processing protein TSR2, motif protein [Medicago truncatula]
MDTINRETETLSRIRLQESIILLLSRWYALQMAIKNQWGGCDSLQKSHQLASHLFSWLSKSNAPIRIEDLENLLYESMLLTFNTEIEDGSIEQVCDLLTTFDLPGAREIELQGNDYLYLYIAKHISFN